MEFFTKWERLRGRYLNRVMSQSITHHLPRHGMYDESFDSTVHLKPEKKCDTALGNAMYYKSSLQFYIQKNFTDLKC